MVVRPKVLLADPQTELRSALRRALVTRQLDVVEAGDFRQAIDRCEESLPRLLITEVRLSADPTAPNGLDLICELRRRQYTVPVAFLSNATDVAVVRDAMRLGARDFIFKDELSLETFSQRVVDLISAHDSFTPPPARISFPSMALGDTPVLVGASLSRVCEIIAKVANSDCAVLIVGETGTGKELVARALHQSSHRAARPMISVNCSAIPSELLESLLFGHERGAFTGADRRRRGRMEVAEDGTILLDEIGDMPMQLQAKLLRVLEDRRILPVGAEKDIELRARIVASTNKDLSGAVAAGAFRKDLFYRLNVIEIRLPNLAERGVEDFMQLLEHFLERAPRPLSLSVDAKLWLAHQHWDGNIRQLKNAIDRLCLLAPSDTIDVATLEEFVTPPTNGELLSLQGVVDDILSMGDIAGPKISIIEKLLIDRAMERSGGNKTSAAKLLGIHRKALERRMERMSQPPIGEDD